MLSGNGERTGEASNGMAAASEFLVFGLILPGGS